MNERQRTHTQQQKKPKFIGSDGSILESLPSDVIGPEAMQSLEQYLDRLTDYDSCQASSLPDVAAEVSTATAMSTERSVSSSSPLMSPAVGIPPGDSLPTHTASFGKESSSSSSLHDIFAGDHSDHGYTDDYRHDTLDSDGEAHDGLLDVDGVKSEDPDVLGVTPDIIDEQEDTKPARAEHKRTKGGRKRPREGDIVASEAQRQKASRDRNREHARNTRIRKKQFVENLRQQVEELLQMKARTERDALVASSKAMTERATRRQMVLNVFYLRATEDLSRQSWTSILDESFTCISPLTPFRWFPPSETREDHRLISGIDGMIQDTASLAVFIQSICCRTQNPAGQKVNYQYYTSPEDTVVGPNALMCRWLMKTENATKCGAQCEVFSHGMLKAKFTSEHRIKHLELVFDVMSFMQQLQRAMGGGGFKITPNTLEAAIQPSRQARLICYAEAPFWIVRANQVWTALMGYSDEEQVKLLPLSLLNGPAEVSTGGELEALVQRCVGTSLKRATMGVVHVVTKDMRRITVSTQAYPLGDRDGSTTHLLLAMEEVPVCQASPQPDVAGLELFSFA